MKYYKTSHFLLLVPHIMQDLTWLKCYLSETIKVPQQVVTLTTVCVPDGPSPALTTLTGRFKPEKLLLLEQSLLQIVRVQVTDIYMILH